MTNTISARLGKSEGHPFRRSCFTALADCKVYVLTNESGPNSNKMVPKVIWKQENKQLHLTVKKQYVSIVSFTQCELGLIQIHLFTLG